jgi:hypothetical protein
METWITHLGSPLVLIGFMLFIVAGLIKLLLKNNIIKVNQANSAKLISKSLNLVFILAFTGMIFGFFSQKEVLQTLPKAEAKSAKPTEIHQESTGDISPNIVSGRDANFTVNSKSVNSNKTKSTKKENSQKSRPTKPIEIHQESTGNISPNIISDGDVDFNVNKK